MSEWPSGKGAKESLSFAKHPAFQPSMMFAGIIMSMAPGASATLVRLDAIGSLGGTTTHPQFRVSDTLGLPLAGKSSGPGYVEWSGFWFPLVHVTSGVPDPSPEDDPIAEGVVPPASTRLIGVFPNPVGGLAEVRFEIAPSSRDAGTVTTVPVRLELFDVSGRLAALLWDVDLPPGAHHYTWQPEGPRAVSNGIYFFRFTCGDHEETRRVTLLR
jgi:hypothetical protein